MIRGLVILTLLFLFSAIIAIAISYYDRDTEPGALELAEDMRARACGGDIEGFNSYIDAESLEGSLMRTELERTRSEYVYSSRKKPKGAEDIGKYIHNSVPDLLAYKLKIYEDQVKAGDSGPICNMEIVKVGSAQKTVKIKFPGGERTTWEFGKVGEDWKLISITDVKPISLASARAFKKKEAKRRKKSEIRNEENKKTHQLAKSFGSDSGEVLDEKSAESVKIADAEDDLIENLASPEIRLSEKPRDVSVEEEMIEPVETPESEYVRDFRNTRWGMTTSEVRKSEAEETTIASPGVLSYSTYYRGELVDLSYRFSENRLKSAGIKFLNERPEEIFYVQDYDKRKAELNTLYGAPVLDEEIWYNRIYEGDPEKIGFAVAIGHLRLRTKWRTGRTEILLELKSEDYDMSLVQSYHSRQP